MDHIKILFAGVTLVFGSWVISRLVHTQKTGRAACLIPLAIHTFSYNLLLFGAVIGKYLAVNLPTLAEFRAGRLFQRIQDILFISLFGLMALSIARIWSALSGSNTKERHVSRAIIAAILLVAIVGVGSYRIDSPAAQAILEATGDLFFLTELAFVVLITVDGFTKGTRRAKSFGLLYLSRYFLLPVILLIAEPFRFIASLGFLFVLNLLPVYWTWMFFRPQFGASMAERGDNIGAYLLQQRVTPREAEIVELLLEGKTNHDIELNLCISPHTVKNHIYNIYRKLHVRGRYDLMSRFSSLRGG